MRISQFCHDYDAIQRNTLFFLILTNYFQEFQLLSLEFDRIKKNRMLTRGAALFSSGEWIKLNPYMKHELVKAK